MTAQPPARQFLPTLQRSATSAFAPIQREFNRLFDELGDSWTAFNEIELAPRMDLREDEKSVELTVELPGLTQADIKIAIEDDVLTISGEKKAEKETTEGSVRISERSYGAFSRSVSLPRSVEANRIKATMADGVLKIVAPKDGSAVSRTIEIQPAK
jgi:HSP20 family protein